jgi:hypothetical protein
MTREQGGRIVRQAWIDGVHKHFEGSVKDSWVSPYDEMRDWERDVIHGVFDDVSAFLLAGGQSNQLSREQGGMLVREAWIVQCYKVLGPNVKPAYVGPWHEMPKWEQEVDCDMFEAIAQSVLSAAA